MVSWNTVTSSASRAAPYLIGAAVFTGGIAYAASRTSLWNTFRSTEPSGDPTPADHKPKEAVQMSTPSELYQPDTSTFSPGMRPPQSSLAPLVTGASLPADEMSRSKTAESKTVSAEYSKEVYTECLTGPSLNLRERRGGNEEHGDDSRVPSEAPSPAIDSLPLDVQPPFHSERTGKHVKVDRITLAREPDLTFRHKHGFNLTWHREFKHVQNQSKLTRTNTFTLDYSDEKDLDDELCLNPVRSVCHELQRFDSGSLSAPRNYECSDSRDFDEQLREFHEEEEKWTNEIHTKLTNNGFVLCPPHTENQAKPENDKGLE